MVAIPEMRFLAQCLPDAAGIVSLDAHNPAQLDWERLIDLATWHGMVPLLSSRLLALDRAGYSVPSTIVGLFKSSQAGYIRRSVSQLAALVELQREFDRERLTVVAWKGPSAGLLLYNSATLRESADLDYLFLEEDLRSILEIARRLGYELLGSSDSESKDIYLFTQQREFTFGRRADQVVLEFHLQIMPARFTLWQDSQADIYRAGTAVDVGDITLLLQRPEDLLVSLCAHATKHGWERLKWSADIAKFLDTYAASLDWASLLNDLRRAQKHSVVLLGLALAESLYGVALPPAVGRELQRTPRVATLVREVAERILSGEKDAGYIRHRKALVDLLCPRLRDRMAYAVAPLIELNYEDLYVPVHHRMLFFMNYAFRVVRLLRKFGPQRLATKTAASVRSVH